MTSTERRLMKKVALLVEKIERMQSELDRLVALLELLYLNM